MRKYIYLVVILAAFCLHSQANPGDTTFVYAHNNVNLNANGNYNAPVVMPNPGTPYRKIIMTFTLGKYQCAASAQYCGDWDYRVTTYFVNATDTFELGRLITPYANASYPRTGWDWKQRYEFDVTDLYPVLVGNGTIRIQYAGFSGGFTTSVKFAFIEGTPPRDVMGVSRFWNKLYSYGDPANPIDNNVTPVSLTAPAGTQSAEMKVTITGHGSDDLNCSEFCSKYYQAKQNGIVLEQKSIWKADCGSNHLYPQSGTWIYNRANWCPGELVEPYVHKFSNITAGTSFTADVDFQPYTRSGTGTPQYAVGGLMLFYGGFNKTLDASLEEIISPSTHEANFRANPTCGKPIIRVKNTGSSTINSITFQYGITGMTPQSYTYSGIGILPLAETTISLPDLAPLATMPASTNSEFFVTIQQVNGVADADTYNNTLKTDFITPVDWPATFNVVLKTNTSSPYYLETSWRIETLTGTIVAQRNPAAANTTYTDPIASLASGCYKFIVNDAGCNGAYWWANSSTTGTGWVYPQNTNGTYLPLNNGLPAFPSSLSQDFGCGYTQYFRVGALLPVELLSFSGKGNGKTNQLFWETAQEANSHIFEVECSATGYDFIKVAEVLAKGNATIRSYYQTTHSPLANSEVYYYRLKMVDKDGSYKYSNVVTIKPTLRDFSVSAISPNPFIEQIRFTVTASKAANATISLYDALGKLHHRESTTIRTGINTLSVENVRNLPAGSYVLELNIGGEKSVQKLIKN